MVQHFERAVDPVETPADRIVDIRDSVLFCDDAQPDAQLPDRDTVPDPIVLNDSEHPDGGGGVVVVVGWQRAGGPACRSRSAAQSHCGVSVTVRSHVDG